MMSKWPYARGPEENEHSELNPKISNGLMIGLDTLINMFGSRDSDGKMMTMMEYLKNEVELFPRIEVHVMGVSLGGSLSNVLGLYLYENLAIWNPAGGASLNVHSFAAFSPGNDDFRVYYEERLKENTTRTFNTLDLAAKLFSHVTLSEIPELYEPYIGSNIFIELIVKFISFLSGCNEYVHVLEDAEPLVGKYKELPDDGEVKDCIDEFFKFFNQAIYQHAQAYFDALGISDMFSYFPPISRLGVLFDRENFTEVMELIRIKIKGLSLTESPKVIKKKKKVVKRKRTRSLSTVSEERSSYWKNK